VDHYQYHRRASEVDQSVPTGTDFLQLKPTDAPPKGLTTWLAGAVRAAIDDGRLPAGQRLPATRELAQELRISRGVVVEAYRRLTDEGVVTARAGVGTVVTPLTSSPEPGEPRTDPAVPLLPQRPTAPVASVGDKSTVSVDLSPGVPDLSLFPRAMWLRAERAVLAAAGPADLGYGDPRGAAGLRQEVAGWLARSRGIRAVPDDIIIVAGVAQALAMLARVLHTAGTTAIAMEDPGSRGARDQLAHWGLAPVPVPVDDHGLRVADLAKTGLRTVFVTPAHQFPTGVVMTPDRRRALLDWAGGDGLVIEDDYDAEYRYDRAPVPALKASAPDRVAYAGSTSKTLAPGMRLGWLLPPRRLYEELVVAKHASDLGSPAIPQLVFARMLATGEFARHVRLVRARHKARRDALLAALHQHLPFARVRGAAAGLHLMILLPGLAGVDDTDLVGRVREAGVLVHPLSWHRQRPGVPGFVIGYAAHPPGRLREAAQRIAAIIQSLAVGDPERLGKGCS
jgi:GntR family transcriptional regulator/MocR family aminotransferase